jgi:hypothetical protein
LNGLYAQNLGTLWVRLLHSWLNMAPVGREFGSPDYERLEREDQTAFIRRGKTAIARSMARGDWIPAEDVLAKLETKVATARLRRCQN